MADELSACPFCACAMDIRSNRDWHTVWGSHDERCVFDADDHALMMPATPEHRVELISTWNRRVSPPANESKP